MKKVMFWAALVATSLVLVGCGSKTSDTGDSAVDNTTNTVNNVATKSDVAKSWDTVKVDYIGTLEDGSVFDTSIAEKAKEAWTFDEQRPYEPLLVNLGKNEVIPGFEKWIEWMKVGETKKISLTSDEAYGQPRPELVQKVPTDTFSGSEIKPEVGKTYNFGVAQGTIKEMNETEVTIDFNHPLAGKALMFEVTLKEIMPAAAVADTQVQVLPSEEEAVVATGN